MSDISNINKRLNENSFGEELFKFAQLLQKAQSIKLSKEISND